MNFNYGPQPEGRALNECSGCHKTMTSCWGSLCETCARATGVDTEKVLPSREFLSFSTFGQSRILKERYRRMFEGDCE